MQLYELDAYLGDFANDVTEAQKAMLMRISDELDLLYPPAEEFDEHEEERLAAFSAAVQYVMGDLDVDSAGENLLIARLETVEAMAAARQVAVMAAADGEAEASIARKLGVDRMTVRKWLGKR
jgi:hypothetical protein